MFLRLEVVFCIDSSSHSKFKNSKHLSEIKSVVQNVTSKLDLDRVNVSI